MPRNVTVRDASADDVTAIQHVARAAWHAAYDDALSESAIDSQVDQWYRHDVVAEAVESDEVVYTVASADDVVGYASAGPSEHVDDEDRRVAQLYTIYVAPRYWGEGIGSQLLDTVTDRLRERGYDAVRAAVLEANDIGRSFYESYGFVETDEGTATIAGEDVDEVVYTATI